MKAKLAVGLAVLIGTLPAFALPPPGGRPAPARPAGRAPVVVHRAAPAPRPAPARHHDRGPSRGLANAVAITELVAVSVDVLAGLCELFSPREEVIVVPAAQPAQNVIYVPANGSQVITVPAR